jgi:hypothetical protein
VCVCVCVCVCVWECVAVCLSPYNIHTHVHPHPHTRSHSSSSISSSIINTHRARLPTTGAGITLILTLLVTKGQRSLRKQCLLLTKLLRSEREWYACVGGWVCVYHMSVCVCVTVGRSVYMCVCVTLPTDPEPSSGPGSAQRTRFIQPKVAHR